MSYKLKLLADKIEKYLQKNSQSIYDDDTKSDVVEMQQSSQITSQTAPNNKPNSQVAKLQQKLNELGSVFPSMAGLLFRVNNPLFNTLGKTIYPFVTSIQPLKVDGIMGKYTTNAIEWLKSVSNQIDQIDQINKINMSMEADEFIKQLIMIGEYCKIVKTNDVENSIKAIDTIIRQIKGLQPIPYEKMQGLVIK